MRKKIALITRLDETISASQGGGQRRVVSEWNIGPRNLLRAIKQLHEELRDNRRSFGNVGRGTSWLEVNGKRLYPTDYEYGELNLAEARLIISRAA